MKRPCTPSHTQQWFHNNQANLHLENIWVLVSSSLLYRLQVELATIIPRPTRLALVANLFSKTLQVVTSAVGITLLTQKILNTVPSLGGGKGI